MRRLLLPLVFLPLLSACGPKATITYDLDVNELPSGRESAVVLASLRVVERRMANIGDEIRNLSLDTKGDTHAITVEVETQEAIDALTEAVTLPFEILVMKEAAKEDADISVEGHGGFSETGLQTEHFLWLEASEEEGGKGRISISFTEEGRAKMQEIFQNNVHKYIGLFVRRNLISKLYVDTDELKDDIIITDIPTVQLANVFADDINVGLHVTFKPQP